MENSIPALPPSSSPEAGPHDRHHGGQAHAGRRHTRRRRGFVAGLVLGVIGAGVLGFAIGATAPVADAALGALAHHSFGHDDGEGPSPDEIRDHAEFFVSFALHRLDATPDQQDRVQKIVDQSLTELLPVVAVHRANRDTLHELLKAPTIDRAAIEKLRGEEMAQAEALSRIVADTIAGAAEVLTVEQRTELIEHLERFRNRG